MVYSSHLLARKAVIIITGPLKVSEAIMYFDINPVEYIQKNILVTGGAGFIGSHLVKRLITLGCNVLIVEMPNTNMQILEEQGKVEVAFGDITDNKRMQEIFGSFKPSKVFHLAAYGIDSKDNNINKSIMVNVLGSANIISYAALCDCEIVVSLGSCAEYGNYKWRIAEDTLPMPVNSYGSTKAAATIIIQQLATSLNVKNTILRPFGVYGEGEAKHKIFCHAITTLLKEKDLELTYCTQIRDYCHVENLVDAMLIAGCSNSKTGVYNIGSGEIHPLKYYIELIHQKIGGKGKLIFGALPTRDGELWSPEPDISKITDELGWYPKISLDEGLTRTIEWFRMNLHKYP